MRLCLICLLVLLGFSVAQAQIISNDTPPDPEPSNKRSYNDELGLIGSNFYLSANIGAALPLGKYSSVDIFSNDSKFASPGFAARINMGIIFKRYVGLTASFGLLSHNINLDQYTRRLNFINPGVVVTDIEYRGFKHAYGTAGLLLSFPIKPMVAIDLRIQAGFVYGIEARKALIITDGSSYARVEVERGLDASFMFNPGVSVRILPSKRLLLIVSLDNMLANYTFRNVTQTINGTNPFDLEYQVKMRNISLSFGVGILLK